MPRVSVSIPESLLAEIDRIAKQLGVGRSQFLRAALEQAVVARDDDAVTQRLDELFSDPEVADHQRAVANQLAEFSVDWAKWHR